MVAPFVSPTNKRLNCFTRTLTGKPTNSNNYNSLGFCVDLMTGLHFIRFWHCLLDAASDSYESTAAAVIIIIRSQENHH